MKIHYAPEVVLVWRPTFVEGAVEKLLAKYGQPLEGWRRDPGDGDGDGIPELYGRMCYSSYGKLQGRVGARAYHSNILSSGHGSVLETATWGFAVFGASRGFLAQMTRHRAGFAYAAESTHFTQYSDDNDKKGVVEPGICVTGIPPGPPQDFMIDTCHEALLEYDALWQKIRSLFPEDAKVKKLVSGAARGLLPTALECKLGFTANARALRHVCEMRGTVDNTLEIRLVAVGLAEIMKLEAPAIFQDFEIVLADDGYPVVRSAYPKV